MCGHTDGYYSEPSCLNDLWLNSLVTTYTFGKQSISSENGPKKVKLEVHVIKQKAVDYIDLLYFAWKHPEKFH